MSTLETTSLDDLDSLLDKNLDDIADLPEFKTFAAGVHKSILNWKVKEIEKNVDGTKKKVPHIECSLTLVETLEHADAKDNDNPGKAGDKCSTAYDLTNENAMGALKKATLNLGAHLGTKNLKEIIKATEGFEVAAVTTQRKDRDFASNGRVYLQIQDMLVV